MSAESLEMMFREFCLTTMAARCGEMMECAEAQNWGYRKLLLQLCEAEAADRRVAAYSKGMLQRISIIRQKPKKRNAREVMPYWMPMIL